MSNKEKETKAKEIARLEAAAKSLLALKKQLKKKERELDRWEKKLEDREDTLRASYLEIKNERGTT